MSSSLLNVITYYQRSIEKNGHDEKRLLHCIEKLYKLPVKLEHLQTTGVGKTVNSLRKYEKEVGVAAKALVAKWKAMVAAEVPHEEEDEDMARESQDDDHEDQDEDSPDRDNTQTITQNGRVNEERVSSKHHSKHREHHSSPSSRDKHRNEHESSKQSNRSSEHSKSHSSHNSSTGSKHKHETRKIEKHGHNSSRREEKERRKHADGSKDIKKLDSDSEDDDLTTQKRSIVEEIEQDFMVDEDDDDDDEEKLVIDVSKEKTDENEKRSKSESQEMSTKHRHHSKDNSRKESKEDSSNKKSRYEEKSPKRSSRGKESSRKESSHSSREKLKKESSQSDRDHSRDKSRRKDDHSKEFSSSRKEDIQNKDKSKEKESSAEKQEDKVDRTYSSSHKSRHSDKERASKKDHKEKQSSSSHKDRHKDKEREKEKEKEKGKEKELREREIEYSTHRSEDNSKRKISESNSKSSESSPVKAKVPKLLVDGIDSSMGTSFEEALGMISVTKGSKNSSKRSPKAGTSSSSGYSSGTFAKPSSRSRSPPTKSETPPLLTTAAKLEPLDPSIALELPAISPNYKPLPLNPTVMDCVFSQSKPQKRLLTDEEALSQGISSKTIRTKVYSGAKLGGPQIVPTLFDLCIRVLQKNIDALEYTGGVPFEVLKQVLERASPQQLLIFEEYNPYLMEDSDILWKQHCMRFYRGQKRQEMETWREMFLRCKDEQERKLSMLAENIKQSQKIIQQPIRKTQLAYVDSMVKPPRNVMRKQEQYGTKSTLTATPAARVASLANLTPNVPRVGDAKLRAAAKAPDTAQIAVAPTNNGRPKKAPLMQKTINFMKGRFKR